jgi:hypothetical protein
MKKYILYLLALCAPLLPGCSPQDTPLYGDDNYLQFRKTQDTVTVAFFLHSAEADSYDFPVQVEMSGLAPAAEREYKIVVDRKNSTAVEGTHFTMPAKTSFKAGETVNTTHVRFMRTDDMKTERYTLVLRVEDNGNYLAGQMENRYIAIKVHDQIAQPAWWTAYVSTNYMGAYSDDKFRHFLVANDHPNLDNITGNFGLIREYALRLKRYLEDKALAGQTVYEADGSTKMTVPVIN